MKKRILSGTLLCLLLMTGCSNEKIAELNKEIEQLREDNESLKQALQEAHEKKIENENTIFPSVSRSVEAFIKAMKNGELHEMTALFGPNVTLQERDGNVYVITPPYEVIVYHANSPVNLEDWTLTGYGYDYEEEVIFAHTQLYLVDETGKGVEQANFLNFKFEKINGEWKIAEVFNDV